MKFLLTLFFAAQVSLVFAATSPAPRPNILFIFSDDHAQHAISAYGSKVNRTPHLDRLGAAGIRFNHAFVTNSICTPSRAVVLTGKYSHANGTPVFNVFDGAQPTVAKMLQASGYHTGMIGKWHLGAKAPYLPTSYGFDSYFGLPYSNDMWPVGYDGKPITDTADRKFKYPPLYLLEGSEPMKLIQTLEDQALLTGMYTERAVEFIDRHKESPFFLYLAHSMPHVPIAVSEKYKDKSGTGIFGDLMLEIDDSIGEVMTALERNGLTDNTLVIFTSDNGPWLTFGNHAGSSGGLREGKGSAWEGGIRVPCIMSYPGVIPAGTVSNNLAATMDIFPTMAALLDAPLPGQKIDGVNILPLLQQVADANPRDHFVYYYDANSMKAIRQGKWKLVFPHLSQTYLDTTRGNDGFPGIYKSVPVPLALYDLSTDPGETFDLASQHPDLVEALSALAEQYRKTLGDDLTKQPGTEKRQAAKMD